MLDLLPRVRTLVVLALSLPGSFSCSPSCTETEAAYRGNIAPADNTRPDELDTFAAEVRAEGGLVVVAEFGSDTEPSLGEAQRLTEADGLVVVDSFVQAIMTVTDALGEDAPSELTVRAPRPWRYVGDSMTLAPVCDSEGWTPGGLPRAKALLGGHILHDEGLPQVLFLAPDASDPSLHLLRWTAPLENDWVSGAGTTADRGLPLASLYL